MGTLPDNPQGLSADMLTEALRRSGAIGSSRVTSFEAKVIGAGAGFMGELAQVTLQYDRPEDGAPRSLIAKFPAAAVENREVAMFFRFYEREVKFYEQIAEQVELRIPKCYFSHYNPETGSYVLLLEDLAPARVGDQLAGCAGDKAELCLSNLAKFHATWWESEALERLDWMPSIKDDWYIQAVEEGYGQAWEPFLAFFGDKISPALQDVAKRFGDHIRPLMTRFGSGPRTIIHGDYRLDNLFFGTPEGGDPLAVIDWQISSRGRGVFDVAYFTSGTMPPAERKGAEQDLLRMYHGILTKRGVAGYSFDDCWQDYRRSLLFCLVYAVIGIGSLDLANERGVELFTTIAQRTFAAIEDLKAYELIG